MPFTPAQNIGNKTVPDGTTFPYFDFNKESDRLAASSFRFIEEIEENYGYVPNYPKPIDTNPFYLIEGNENKIY